MSLARTTAPLHRNYEQIQCGFRPHSRTATDGRLLNLEIAVLNLGGANRTRTDRLLRARQALSQMSYSPKMLLIEDCFENVTEDAEDPTLGDDCQYHKDANTDCYPMPQFHDTLQYDIWRKR